MSNTCQKCEKLERILVSVSDNMGLYPKAISGYGDECDYEQRDGYKNGWNACVMEYGKAFNAAIEEAKTVSDVDVIFMHDEGTFTWDNGWYITLNDVWGYACADSEPIPKDKEDEVAALYLKHKEKHGNAGALYWVFKQRGYYPDIEKYKEAVMCVERVEECIL